MENLNHKIEYKPLRYYLHKYQDHMTGVTFWDKNDEYEYNFDMTDSDLVKWFDVLIVDYKWLTTQHGDVILYVNHWKLK